MLTTASITFSATSAMPSGPRAQRRRARPASAGGAKADRGQQRAQAMARGWNRTGHVESLS